jgi:voltage-gated potassium channel
MLPETSTGRRWFELLAQVLVFYSIIVLYMETEARLSGDAAAPFWLWNERLLLVWFAVEYLTRWALAKNRWRYPITIMGVIDLLAILPSIVGIASSFRSLKLLRALRMLRLLKLYRYNQALQHVMHGFRRVRHELAVVGFVAVLVLVSSSIAMHELEHEAQPEKFARLSDAVWWSFVTLSTVGYGDIYPITSGGRIVAVLTMIVGIGIFGTFISLVGSSFLATMNHDRAVAERKREHADEDEDDDSPWVDPLGEPPPPKGRFTAPPPQGPSEPRRASSRPAGN